MIPTLRKYDGFAGYIALYDEDGGRAKGLLLWESKETAEAAEAELAEMRTQVAIRWVSLSSRPISTRPRSSSWKLRTSES